MEKLDPQIDGATPDIVQQNVEQLKALFPEIVTEGNIDFDTLREVLGDYTDEREERYNFTWNGKSRARRLAQIPSTGTLRPCPEESVNWDTTQNLFIEGDNLEVLKLLQKAFHRKVKMIYIDPPYNTGGDFIYPDDFRHNIANYLQITGQTDETDRKLSTNPETSGRYHTDWLSMMYPRLKLARNLLADDGLCFISINEYEVTNLRRVCDETFGEECLVGTFVWQSKKGGGSASAELVADHEYVICYKRTAGSPALAKVELQSEPLDQQDEKGRFRRGRELNKWGASSRREDRPSMFFPIPGPDGVEVFPIRNDGSEGRWRLGKPAMLRLAGEGDIDFVGRQDGTYIAYEKVRTEAPRAKPHRTWLGNVGTTADGSKTVKELFDGVGVFDFPKPVPLLSQLIDVAGVEDGDIVLDFFAGSCTTAHAVLDLNHADNGRRRFVMIQLPEPCDQASEAFKAGYATIADVGRDRIRRVLSQIEAQLTEEKRQLIGVSRDALEQDLGFKALELDTSNIKVWDVDFEDVEGALLSAAENVKPDRSAADVLYELLLKYGLDLAAPIERREIAGKAVHIIGAGALIVCLADEIVLDAVEGIAALKKELSPETIRVVFKDSGFADDVVKTNAVQILHQAGIEDVRSL